ncbi:MAG TPA: trehalose-phosphatase [Steroidobacteraceae bacterium]|nr:trehalose-phosphatase [Steroidobacteraceae bacterium]
MMQIPPPSPSLEWCLFLDVDGTLIELTDSPLETFADQELKTLLGTVVDRLGGAVALVSGRSIEYLDALFDPLRLPAAGLHGVERRKASGGMQGSSFVDTRLDRARAAVQALVSAHQGTSVEDKGRTIAVHFRMAPHHEASIRESLAAIAAPLDTYYHVQEGNMVLEIMPRGFNKGAAVKAFMRERPFSGRRPIFVGDDLTDQGAFRVAEDQGGHSIAVGDRVQGQYRIDDSAAVRSWLRGIAALHDSQRE